MQSLFGVGSRENEQQQQQQPQQHNQQLLPTTARLCLTVQTEENNFSISAAVLSTLAFQQTLVGRFLSSAQQQTLELGDALRLEKVEPSVVRFSRSSDSQSSAELLAGVELWLLHMTGQRPLEKCPLRSIVQDHQRLCEAWKRLAPNSLTPSLPFRLWTARRWTDVTGVYALSSEDAALLQLGAVAVQLPDRTVQGVRRLRQINLEAHRPLLESMLTCPEEEWPRILAAYEYMSCYLVLLQEEEESDDGSETPPAAASAAASTLVTMLSSGSPAGAAAVSASPAATATLDKTTAVAHSLLIKLPHVAHVAAYDLPPGSKGLQVPHGTCDFPAFYRRGDRLVFLLSRKFALEIAEIVSEVSGITKLRASSLAKEAVPAGSSDTAAAAAGVMMNLFKDKRPRREWQCFHPVLPVRYVNSSKAIKELGEVAYVRMYSWGALLVLARPDSPFAILSIDQREMRAVYGEHVTIYLRGLPPSLQRGAIDVAVTAGLERVYLCCFGQIASAAVVPMQSRIDFAIEATSNRQFKLRLVHPDIPEGAPTGANMKFLHSLGLLVEFRTDTAMYYQNALCKQLCPRYTKTTTTAAAAAPAAEAQGAAPAADAPSAPPASSTAPPLSSQSSSELSAAAITDCCCEDAA